MSESPTKSHKSHRRQLRERKQRKLYSDEWALGDDDYEGARGFSVAEKLESPRFAQSGMVREMKGSDLTVGFLQQHGFNIPLLFKEKTGLGIHVPSANFTIHDVRMCVGSKRVLDVMDVNTQKNLEMTMKEWEKYYEDTNRKRLLNVISLEFSNTKLANYVQSPSIVRQIDWVDVVWPRGLKEAQIESTNLLTNMMYPKVQKYCLMSVKNCYTDFHIDFGGTSVWYHILKGSKVFWLIPPTEKNLQLYEKWILSGKQSDVFFGDTVEKCVRIYLTAGNTFFIPTGWIHAVYTPTDTLVFGGNFLHSFGIVKQLKCAQVEDTTKVPQKFRYPFFTEMLWHVLAKYVYTLLGRSHIEGESSREEEVASQPHVHLTHYELFGLKEIVMFLYDLPPQRKNVPELIKDPVALIKDVRTLVERHCKDSPDLAITGVPILKPELNINHHYQYIHDNDVMDYDPNDVCKAEEIDSTDHSFTVHESVENVGVIAHNADGNFVQPQPSMNRPPGIRGPYKKHNLHKSPSSSFDNRNHHNMNGPRRRRTRCKVCEACKRSDCSECAFCLDMVKFGGPGRAKQTCMMRQCLQPMLPITAQCIHCHLDGWRQTPIASPAQAKMQASMLEGPSSLMECSVCYEITHPDCAQKLEPETNGIVNEDLPNSWECPSCCKSGKNTDYRPRHFRARQKSSDIRRTSISSDGALICTYSPVNSEHQSGSHHSMNNEKSMIDYMGVNSTALLEHKAKIKDEEISDESDNEAHKMNNSAQIKLEIKDEQYMNNSQENNGQLNLGIVKRRKSDDGNSICSSVQDSIDTHDTTQSRKKPTVRAQLAQQIYNTSSKVLKKPLYPVRPAHNHGSMMTQNQSTKNRTNSQKMEQWSIDHPTNCALDPTCLLAVFRHLPPEALVSCSLVCKTWSTMSVDPSLWKKMNCAEYKLTASLLTAIVRRQPEYLIMDWIGLGKRQVTWLVSRIPGLKHLSLQGTPIQAVLGLHTCMCPPLNILDLSFVAGLNDSALREILSPPKDSRPGLSDSKSRLRNLKMLKLAGTDISDVALRYVTQGLPYLTHLDLSSCQRITDAGVAQIGTSAIFIKNLIELDLSSCKLITELALDHLSKCDTLTRLDLRHVPQVSTQSVIKFAAKSKNNLQVQDIKLVDKRKAL